MPRFSAAFLAGAIAILVNTAALGAADLVPLATAHGGLLRLLIMLTGGIFTPPTGVSFQTAFHIVVGLAMAEIYAFALEPFLNGPSWLRGSLYALVMWLANACVILPATGEGFAGSRHLSTAGMAWFAAAHTVFFVLMAVIYERLRQNPKLVSEHAL